MAWRAQGHRFDLRWGDLQCQTLRPEPIKREDLAARCTVCTFSCVWASRLAKPRLLTQKPSPKAGSGTRKQHGLASSRTSFFDLRWGDLQCQTLRPEPIKREDLTSRCTVCTFSCVWATRPAKPRLLTLKPSPKGWLPNGKTAWPGELKDTVFRPALGGSSMSNIASRAFKKRGFGFEMHRLHLQLRLGVTTGKTTTSDPKAFPKRLAPERGNSMAWRAQGHRFSTCVGVIFNVKRCVQNLLKERIWLPDAPFAPSVVFGRHDRQNHDFWPKSLPKKAALRRTFSCVWPSRPAKPRLLTEKASPKRCLWNRETAWPGELKGAFFWPVCDFQCQTLRTYKKERVLQLWALIRTSNWLWDAPWVAFGRPPGKATTSRPKMLPKTRPPKRGNSKAWPAQDAMGDKGSCSVLSGCCVGGACVCVCVCVFDVVFALANRLWARSPGRQGSADSIHTYIYIYTVPLQKQQIIR